MKKIAYLLLILFMISLQNSQAWVRHRVVGGAPAAGSCDPAINEIGNRNLESSNSSFSGGSMFCQLASADCTGTVADGYLYRTDTDQAEARFAVYSDDGDGVPNVGDTLISSAQVDLGVASGWRSGTIGTGNVTDATNYWVCVGISSTATVSTRYVAGSSGYYDSTCDCYTSACSDLSACGFSLLSRNYSLYVEIGN